MPDEEPQPVTLSMFLFTGIDWNGDMSDLQQCLHALCLGYCSGSICFTLPSNHSDVSTLSSGYDECNFPMFS